MNRNRWIASPAYDLPLIVLAPFVGLSICAVALLVGEARVMNSIFVEVNFFFLGMPHYLSTYAFYMDDDNMRHYRSRRLMFFAGPLFVILLLTGGLALHFYFLIAVFVDSWNAYHVSRQSAGILSVYRHRGNGNNATEKWPALLAVVGSAMGLYFFTGHRQPSLVKLAGPEVTRWLTNVLAPALLTVAALALLVLIRYMIKRSASLPEWVFLGSSLLLFAPYLLLDSFGLATSALLSGHYIQYLSLLWLVNRRKYVEPRGSAAQRLLTAISHNGKWLFYALGSLALFFFAIDRVTHHFSWIAFHTFFLNAVVLLHYYLDGVFWAFKDPYVRQSLGPYLTGGRSAGGVTTPTTTPVVISA